MDVINTLQQTPLDEAVNHDIRDVGGIKCYIKGVSPDGSPEVYHPSASPKREEAAYRFDQWLGLNLVPPTTCRVISAKWFSIQQHSALKLGGSITSVDALLFDSLIHNTDRHSGNWLSDGTTLVLIDHGYAFRELDYKYTISLRSLYPSESLTLEHRELCLKVRHGLRELHTLLGDLLESVAINAVVRRASRMLRTNQYAG